MNEKSDIEEFAPWLVLVITLVGGVIRILLIGSKGLWLDESFSIWLAQHSVADMLGWIVKIDQHPPLYYLLLHYWVALTGDTPGSVRLLSALFGTATIPVIYLIGRRLSGVAVGVAAAVLLAFSPFNIRFAQEARMYTLLTFNASVAIYALVRLLTDPRAARPIGSQFREYLHAWRTLGPVERDAAAEFSYADLTRSRTGLRGWIYRHRWSPVQTIETDLAWVVLIVFSAATFYSHNTAVLFLAAVNIFVLGLLLYQRIRKSGSPSAFQAPPFWNWVKAQVGVLVLWSPWIPAFIEQTSRVDQEFWIPAPTWDYVVQVLRTFLNDSVLGASSQFSILWIVYVLVLCLGLVFFRKNLSRLFFLAALFAVPFLGELLVSLRRPIFYDRTLIWLTVPLLLFLAAGIAQLRFRLLTILMIGVFATINLFSAVDNFRYIQKENLADAAGYVANFVEKGDLVLFNAGWVQIPFDYYFQPYEEQYSLQVVKHGVPADMFDRGILEPIMTVNDIPALLTMISGQKHVWLVYSHNSYTDPARLIPQTLASRMTLVQKRDYYGVQVLWYEAP